MNRSVPTTGLNVYYELFDNTVNCYIIFLFKYYLFKLINFLKDSGPNNADLLKLGTGTPSLNTCDCKPGFFKETVSGRDKCIPCDYSKCAECSNSATNCTVKILNYFK